MKRQLSHKTAAAITRLHAAAEAEYQAAGEALRSGDAEAAGRHIDESNRLIDRARHLLIIARGSCLESVLVDLEDGVSVEVVA